MTIVKYVILPPASPVKRAKRRNRGWNRSKDICRCPLKREGWLIGKIDEAERHQEPLTAEELGWNDSWLNEN